MYENWRSIPARTVIAVITDLNGGNYPPTFDELQEIVRRLGYVVYELPRGIIPAALTRHDTGTICLPPIPDDERAKQLLHELAEILLRLAVAPEFHYPPSPADEHHAVARLVEASVKSAARRQAARSRVQMQTIQDQIAQLQQRLDQEAERLQSVERWIK